MGMDYILGTDIEELNRLGFQHAVWATEAHGVWHRAGIRQGSSVLDVGCGPGFCSFDLANIVGPKGQVIGVEVSEPYVNYARQQSESRHLFNTSFHCASALEFEPEAPVDFIYLRWVLSWIEPVAELIERLSEWLKPGGKLILQEYVHWGTFRIAPEIPEVRTVIEACRESWRLMPSEIDIAPALPEMLVSNGLKLLEMQPLQKVVTPKDIGWEWPGTFLHIYSDKLVEMGLLNRDQQAAFKSVWPKLSKRRDALILTPLMMELIAAKPA